MLVWIILAPVVGAALVFLLPGSAVRLIRGVALLSAAIPVAVSVWVIASMARNVGAMQLTASFGWLASLNVDFAVGVDGLNLPVLLLSVVLGFVGVLASRSITTGVKSYYALFLLVSGALSGVFLATDFLLFFACWQLVLLGMYFLIGNWGGPQSGAAAVKFYLHANTGSVFLLLGLLTLYFVTEPHSFDWNTLREARDQYPESLQYVLWLTLFIGFASVVPIFPFHSWLPDAHSVAPAPVAALLAGLVLKMGAYGILRWNVALLSEATAALALPFLGVLGVFQVAYGALCAMGQTELKRMIAYLCMSLMGMVMLGIATMTAAGASGAVLLMFHHGVLAALLFLAAGALQERAGHDRIAAFGGLASHVPVLAAFVALGFLAALAMPGLAPFVAELQILMGAWQRVPELAFFAALSMVLIGGAVVWTMQRLLFGALPESCASLADARRAEVVPWVPLALLLIGLGLYPQPLIEAVQASVFEFITPIVAEF